ncbi:MAG: thiamine-phosphate kinase [Gemmatimonadaceae bacterium]
MTRDIALGAGREFDVIRLLLNRWGSRADGIGDDAALVALPVGEQLVVSTDTSVEDVHFRREWLSPREIGYRATTAALSDLAAMAARPTGILVALTLPEAWLPDVMDLADGIGEAAAAAGASIIGGDLTRGRDLALAVTVLGATARPLSRSGARAGDGLYVTGILGGPREAVAAWTHGAAPSVWARERFAHPTARFREAQWLAEHGATAAVDISDGLVADVGHLAHASGARATVHLERVLHGGGSSVERAAASGEEYELVVTGPESLDTAKFERAFGVPLTRVGSIADGAPGVDAFLHGERVAPPSGWDHFS